MVVCCKAVVNGVENGINNMWRWNAYFATNAVVREMESIWGTVC